MKVLEASLDWQETLIEEAVEQENEPLVEAQRKGKAIDGYCTCWLSNV